MGFVSNLSLDYGRVIGSGLLAVRENADGYGRRVIDAIIDLGDRYKRLAVEQDCHDVVEVLSRVPRYGATNFREAQKVFGSDLIATLYTVAKDVKLRLTFDPAYVASYRQIGYENRQLSREDFTDDTKDAGEVGAGHQVTVFYELVMTENGQKPDLAENTAFMTLAVRYKAPDGDVSKEDTYSIGVSDRAEFRSLVEAFAG